MNVARSLKANWGLQQVTSIFFVCVTAFGCGDGDGIKYNKSAAKAEDATKAGAEDSERKSFLAQFETEDFRECNDRGFVYHRRNEKCLTDLKVAKFPCTRIGVVSALSSSGAQIGQILDRSLGKEGVPGDKGEGYVLDQCGQAANGRIWVNLLRQGSDGKFEIREIESK